MASPVLLVRQLPPAIIVLSLAACAVGRGSPRVLSSATIKAKPVARVEWIGGWDSAMATAIATMERELGIPRFEVSLHLFAGREAFEAALVRSGYPSDFARDTARTMTAIGGYRAVLVNEGNLLAAPWERRLGLLAHELAHSLQYELGGGQRGTSDQWLREGFAEWVSVRVLQRLEAASLDQSRHRALRALRGRRRVGLPALEQMLTFPQWVALGQGPHAGVVYDFAFAAVDFLIRRHGFTRAVRYFELFAGSPDRAANFRAAFGEDLADFERAFRAEVWPAALRGAGSGHVRVEEVHQVLDRHRLVEHGDAGTLQLDQQRRVRIGGHHRHGQAGDPLAQAGGHGDAVLAGHDQVHQGRVVLRRVRARERVVG
jgi:hypothetical protein